MREYEFSYKFRWNGKEEESVIYKGGKYESENDAMKALRDEIISDIKSCSGIDHVRNGIVIVGEDSRCNQLR